MKKIGTIDRFEGNLAIVEMDGGEIKEMPSDKMPSGAVEGSVIELTDDGILLLDEETARRRKNIERLMDGLFEK